MHDSLTAFSTVTLLDTPESLAGILLLLRITRPGCPPLLICGVYAPCCDCEHRNALHDTQLMHTHIEKTIQAEPQGSIALLLGDWNAVNDASGRPGHIEYGRDRVHQRFVNRCALHSIGGPSNRATFWTAAGAPSALDHIYTTDMTMRPQANAQPMLPTHTASTTPPLPAPFHFPSWVTSLSLFPTISMTSPQSLTRQPGA
jgi:hypothetical protein